jgi:hypothetical protein
MMKATHGFLLGFVLCLGALGSPVPEARADYLGDVIRAGAEKRAQGVKLRLPGIQQVQSVEELDYDASLDEQDLILIESALIARLGRRHPIVQNQLPGLLSQLRSSRSEVGGYRIQNTFVYFGGSKGFFLGAGANIGLSFAKTRNGQTLGVFPILFARLNFVHFGSEAHIGVGVLEDAPIINVNVGLSMGGAFFVGGGVGTSRPLVDPSGQGEAAWVEFRVGFQAEFGPYIEFMI